MVINKMNVDINCKRAQNSTEKYTTYSLNERLKIFYSNMVSMYTKQEIILKYHREGKSQRSIARELQMN